MWGRVAREVAHRPWPLPRRPWAMRMAWEDLLFAHWPLPAAALRPLVPPALELETFEGQAWVGVVPFRMADVGLRGLAAPGASRFPELNLRTYVRVGGKPGVFFFSLDAASPLAVASGRRFFRLPYYRARMRCRTDGEGIAYASRRDHPGAPPAEFVGRYRPTGPVFRAELGSLEHWLTERYCLYAVDRRGRVSRGEVHHAPWPLQPAEAAFERLTLDAAVGFALPAIPPLLHFARRLDVAAWLPERLPVNALLGAASDEAPCRRPCGGPP